MHENPEVTDHQGDQNRIEKYLDKIFDEIDSLDPRIFYLFYFLGKVGVLKYSMPEEDNTKICDETPKTLVMCRTYSGVHADTFRPSDF